MLAQVTRLVQGLCSSVVVKPHSPSWSCKIQLKSHRRSICVSPCLQQAMPGVVCPGSLCSEDFCCWERFGATLSSSFRKSTPRMLQACCATTSSEGQAEPIPWERETLQQLTITVPCRAKPMFPSCAWSCEWVMLKVIPKGKRGGGKGWKGSSFLPSHCESALPSTVRS